MARPGVIRQGGGHCLRVIARESAADATALRDQIQGHELFVGSQHRTSEYHAPLAVRLCRTMPIGAFPPGNVRNREINLAPLRSTSPTVI